jgi:hypothetical protein
MHASYWIIALGLVAAAAAIWFVVSRKSSSGLTVVPEDRDTVLEQRIKDRMIQISQPGPQAVVEIQTTTTLVPEMPVSAAPPQAARAHAAHA